MRHHDGSRATGRFLAVFLLPLAIAGCGGGGGRAEAPRPIGDLLAARQVAAPPRLLAGATADHAALLCGPSLHRLTNRPNQLETAPGEGRDYLAAWFGAEAEADCFLGTGPEGPAVARGGQAWRLPGWPAGAGVSVAAFSPDGTTLAVAPGGSLADVSVRLYTVPPATPIVLAMEGRATVEHLAWDGTGKYLLTTDDEGEISIFQKPQKKPVYRQKLDPAVEGPITAVNLSPDGDWFVVAANSIRLRTWRLPFLSAPLKAWGEVRQVFFVAGNAAVVTIDETDSAIRWLVNYGKVKSDRSANLGTLRASAVSADGAGFYTLDTSGRIKAWDASNLEAVEATDSTLCRN